MDIKIGILVPFFNEAHRHSAEEIIGFLDDSPWPILFVNDGSTDSSVDILEKHLSESTNSHMHKIFSLPSNVGKTNAVRLGLIELFKQDFHYVALTDFDLPISLIDLSRGVNFALDNQADLVSGARVKLAGSEVRRTSARHWIGRIIATILFITIDNSMYDPQSPCKVYKRNQVLPALKDTFRTKWFGDLELILRIDAIKIYEFPLNFWRDVPSGKLGYKSILGVLTDLFRLFRIRLSS